MIVFVKLPNNTAQRILAFPFLHVLDVELQRMAKDDPEDDSYELHLISSKKDIDVLNLLPFEAFYHDVEEEDLKTVFTAHRACSNFTRTKAVDLYISTTGSFVDASMGKSLSAIKRHGFVVGKNKWLFNSKVDYPENTHKSAEIFSLIDALIGIKQDIPHVNCRKLSEFYMDWSENPYLVIDLDMVLEKFSEEWLELFELVANQNFVLMSSKLDIHLQNDFLTDYIQTLPSKNTYKIFKYDSNIEFAKLVKYSIGVVTSNPALMLLASYCESRSYFLNQNFDLNLLGPKYFRGDMVDFPYTNPNSFDYRQLFDSLIAILDSYTQAETQPELEAEPQDD